jgi:hypothetical protein
MAITPGMPSLWHVGGAGRHAAGAQGERSIDHATNDVPTRFSTSFTRVTRRDEKICLIR